MLTYPLPSPPQVQDIVVGQKPVGEVVKTNEVLSLLMDDDELAESLARRERAEKEALNAPVTAKAPKGKGKAKAAAAPAAAAISSFGASKDQDEDDFFGGSSKPAPAQDDDDDDAPPGAADDAPPAPKKRKPSKAKGPSKRKKHVDMVEI